jgi:hypothetical protein
MLRAGVVGAAGADVVAGDSCLQRARLEVLFTGCMGVWVYGCMGVWVYSGMTILDCMHQAAGSGSRHGITPTVGHHHC